MNTTKSQPRRLGEAIARLTRKEAIRERLLAGQPFVFATGEVQSRSESEYELQECDRFFEEEHSLEATEEGVEIALCNAPEVDRLTLLCEVSFEGTGLTAINLGKIRGMIREKKSLSKDSADNLTLCEVADFIESIRGDWGTNEISEAESHADYRPFRDGTLESGELLTAKYCKARYGVSGKDLSIAAKSDPSIRRKNPHGRGDVYRYEAVRELNERKLSNQ